MGRVDGTVVMPQHKVQGRVVNDPSRNEVDPMVGSASCFGSGGRHAEEKAEEATKEELFRLVKSATSSRASVERVLTKLASADLDKEACAWIDDGRHRNRIRRAHCIAGGHSLTHWAAKRGDASLLQSFLARGAPVDEPSRDEVGMRPLHWACTDGRLACMRLLVDLGADIDAQDHQGCTPCVIAAQWGQADATAYLVKIGADVRILDKNDDSALHWASYKGNLEIVGLLHHLGLPIEEADSYGQTPLHLAALCGNLTVAEYLLIDAPAASVESRIGRPRSIRQMLESRDKNGKTPLQLAHQKRNHAVARFLASQRPVCEQGILAFVREKLTLAACTYWVLGGSNPEAMKWPWAIMVFNKIIGHIFYFSYFLGFYGGSRSLQHVIPKPEGATAGGADIATGTASVVDVPAIVHAINFNTQIVTWLSFILAWRCDPGSLDGHMLDGALRRAYDAYFDRLVDGRSTPAHPSIPNAPPPIKHPTLCHSCHIQRPVRAKHCRVRRRCVMAFDHYCPYVGNTIGLYNYRFFFVYCLSFTLSALEWQYVAFVYQNRHGRDWKLILTQIWFVPFILFGVAMVTYHTQLIYANLTTNEHMNYHRYEYFRQPDKPGVFVNPFDRGCFSNFADRFFPTPLHMHPLVLQVIAYVDNRLPKTPFDV